MLEEESKIECKSPRLQAELNNRKNTSSPSFLAKRMLSQNIGLKVNASSGGSTPSNENLVQNFGEAHESLKVNPFKKSQFSHSKRVGALSHAESVPIDIIEEELKVID